MSLPEGGSSRLCVTGAGGWIGGALVREAQRRGVPVAGLPLRDGVAGVEHAALEGAIVVHLAAIAHRTGGGVTDDEYRRVNRDLAVQLARAARDAGSRGFVFASTAAVMGPTSSRPWTEADPPAPADPYARAKLQAEEALRLLHDPGRFDVRILRPPLVWGPGVRANFAALLRLAASPLPLPLASARAPRSMIFLDDAVDALLHLCTAPSAEGGTFFVRDDVDRSVAEWIAAIRGALGRPAGLFPVPGGLVRLAATALGRPGYHERLFLAAQVDDAALRATGWHPRTPFERALRATLEATVADPRGRRRA
jgi:nucleoside-diphosphate-sugar epimerase